MASASFLLLAATLALAGAIVAVMSLERRLRQAAELMRRNGVLLAELRRRASLPQALSDVQILTEATVESGTAVVRALHLGLAHVSFGLLESFRPTRGTTRGVRRAHDLVSGVLYDGISGANRAVGEVARSVVGPADSPKKEKSE